jgi:hypothetical protein
MGTDFYWRTRTIAEAQADGYTHLRVTCSGCGRIIDMPWKLLLRPPRITVDSFIGNIPLCCERCGNREPVIGVTRQRDAQGHWLRRQ